MTQQSIQEFYNGKNILITGATGFVGKALVEKLLWSCPGIQKIYIIVRSKKDKAVHERVNEITENSAFDRIRQNHPEYLKKIIALEGDITMNNLGLKNEDLQTIYDNVNVIFHSAASIKMNDPIKTAFENNALSTKMMIQMAKKVKNLEAFIHISTAFSNFYNEHVYEVAYLPPYDPNKITTMLNAIPDDIQKEMEPILLNSMKGSRPFPNTYTYSKFFAEAFVTVEGEGLPRAIVRPSLVISSLNEPAKGWIDNWGGPAERLGGVATGVLRHIDANPQHILDCVPADFTVNCAIAASWKVATEKPKDVQIFNSSTGTSNPIVIREIFDYIEESSRKYPFDRVIRWPRVKFSTDKITKTISPFLYHTIPALAIDATRRLQSKKPMMIKMYSKLADFYKIVHFSANLPYFYHNDNAQKLAQSLSKQDQKEFPFDAKLINWRELTENYVYGVKKYLLKEDCSAEAIRKGQQKMQRLKLMHFGTKFALLGGSLLLAGGLLWQNSLGTVDFKGITSHVWHEEIFRIEFSNAEGKTPI